MEWGGGQFFEEGSTKKIVGAYFIYLFFFRRDEIKPGGFHILFFGGRSPTKFRKLTKMKNAKKSWTTKIGSLHAIFGGRSAPPPQGFSTITFFRKLFFHKPILKIIIFMYYTLWQTFKKFGFNQISKTYNWGGRSAPTPQVFMYFEQPRSTRVKTFTAYSKYRYSQKRDKHSHIRDGYYNIRYNTFLLMENIILLWTDAEIIQKNTVVFVTNTDIWGNLTVHNGYNFFYVND